MNRFLDRSQHNVAALIAWHSQAARPIVAPLLLGPDTVHATAKCSGEALGLRWSGFDLERRSTARRANLDPCPKQGVVPRAKDAERAAADRPRQGDGRRPA